MDDSSWEDGNMCEWEKIKRKYHRENQALAFGLPHMNTHVHIDGQGF